MTTPAIPRAIQLPPVAAPQQRKVIYVKWEARPRFQQPAEIEQAMLVIGPDGYTYPLAETLCRVIDRMLRDWSKTRFESLAKYAALVSERSFKALEEGQLVYSRFIRCAGEKRFQLRATECYTNFTYTVGALIEGLLEADGVRDRNGALSATAFMERSISGLVRHRYSTDEAGEPIDVEFPKPYYPITIMRVDEASRGDELDSDRIEFHAQAMRMNIHVYKAIIDRFVDGIRNKARSTGSIDE